MPCINDTLTCAIEMVQPCIAAMLQTNLCTHLAAVEAEVVCGRDPVELIMVGKRVLDVEGKGVF